MVEEFFELDFGDGGVHVSARVEVFLVEAADCPCDASGGIVHVVSCLHRPPAVGAEPVVFHWLSFLSESECDAAWHSAAVKKPRKKPLTLPTAEAGGILVSSTGCLRVHEGLTGSPQAFGLDVSRPTVCSVMNYAADSSWLRILNPSSLRLLAALTSRSWNTPHCGHVHSRTSRFLTSGLRYPQSWQSWLDG